jgi:hypothetical protein
MGVHDTLEGKGSKLMSKLGLQSLENVTGHSHLSRNPQSIFPAGPVKGLFKVERHPMRLLMKQSRNLTMDQKAVTRRASTTASLFIRKDPQQLKFGTNLPNSNSRPETVDQRTHTDGPHLAQGLHVHHQLRQLLNSRAWEFKKEIR